MPNNSRLSRTSTFKSVIMPKLGAALLAFVLLAVQAMIPAQASGPILYVAPGGMTSGTCSSWVKACNLQFALNTVAVSGKELWVKQGTYKPGTGRLASFKLKNGVRIFGGFAGTETSRAQRNPATHITILSGDIAGDNVYHVVSGNGVSNTAILDGFTIKSGNANGASDNGVGAGFYNNGGSPTLRNLIFTSNTAASSGGGMFNYSFTSSPTLTNVTFSGNSSGTSGGGMYNDGSAANLTNVTFNGNAAANGAGIYSTDTSLTINNGTFTGNHAGVQGGGMENDYMSPTLTNITFTGNSAGTIGGAMYNVSSQPLIYDSIFWNDDDEIVDDILSASTVADSLVAGGCTDLTCTGTTLTTDPMLGPLANNGGYTKTMALALGSPAIDAGNISTCTAADQRGVTRPQGPACDMGAYEAPVTVIFQSIAGQDGWVLESGQNTNVGGSFNNTLLTLNLGDNAANRGYRSVLSFSTGGTLPDNAVISSAKLRLKYGSVTPPSSNPISLLGGIKIDVKKGFFGSSSNLQVTDFQAAGNQTVGPYIPALSGGYYTITLNSTAFSAINKSALSSGLTQMRLRFGVNSNHNARANLLTLSSGDNLTLPYQPALTIVYTTP